MEESTTYTKVLAALGSEKALEQLSAYEDKRTRDYANDVRGKFDILKKAVEPMAIKVAVPSGRMTSEIPFNEFITVLNLSVQRCGKGSPSEKDIKILEAGKELFANLGVDFQGELDKKSATSLDQHVSNKMSMDLCATLDAQLGALLELMQKKPNVDSTRKI